MGNYDDLPVFNAAYDLLLEISRFTKHFSKEYKYTVGTSLKTEAMDLMILIYRANSTMEKADVIQKAREKLEVIRLYVRLMKDLHEIGLKKFVQVNKRIENVSRQLTGWHKKYKKD